MTSEPTEGAGTGAPGEPRQELTAPAERFAHALTAANETAPPPPLEAANSDLEGEAEAEPASAQEWPLAWLRLVEPEPPATDDVVVAAVIAAEPADADGVAHAFGRAMAAALDPEPVSVVEMRAFVEPPEPAHAFYSVPVEPIDEPAAEPDELSATEAPTAAPDEPPAVEPPIAAPERLSAIEADDLVATAAKPSPMGEAEETAVAESMDPPFVSPVHAARRAAVRRAAAEADGSIEGEAGEGGPAAAAYLLYLAGFLLVPAVVGVLLAYSARHRAPAWLQSHYLFLIRTFWIGLAGTAVASALLFSGKLTLAGLVFGLLLVVWLEMRSALGFIRVVKLRAMPRPRSWLL